MNAASEHEPLQKGPSRPEIKRLGYALERSSTDSGVHAYRTLCRAIPAWRVHSRSPLSRFPRETQQVTSKGGHSLEISNFSTHRTSYSQETLVWFNLSRGNYFRKTWYELQIIKNVCLYSLKLRGFPQAHEYPPRLLLLISASRRRRRRARDGAAGAGPLRGQVRTASGTHHAIRDRRGSAFLGHRPRAGRSRVRAGAFPAAGG